MDKDYFFTVNTNIDLQNPEQFSICGQRLFFTVNTNPTRSNGLKLYKNRFNTAIRGHSFSQRIVNDWNTLPHEIVSAPNVLIFKTKVDVFLYDRRFDFI